jgi:hypothetical protein
MTGRPAPVALVTMTRRGDTKQGGITTWQMPEPTNLPSFEHLPRFRGWLNSHALYIDIRGRKKGYGKSMDWIEDSNLYRYNRNL